MSKKTTIIIDKEFLMALQTLIINSCNSKNRELSRMLRKLIKKIIKRIWCYFVIIPLKSQFLQLQLYIVLPASAVSA